MRPCQGGSHVARLSFKTSRVGVYKCLSLIISFAVTVTVWLREVVSCRDFILCAFATFLGHAAFRNLSWQGLKVKSTKYCKIWQLSGRFQTLIWRPGETVQNRESPGLSRRNDSTAKVGKIW